MTIDVWIYLLNRQPQYVAVWKVTKKTWNVFLFFFCFFFLRFELFMFSSYPAKYPLSHSEDRFICLTPLQTAIKKIL